MAAMASLGWVDLGGKEEELWAVDTRGRTVADRVVPGRKSLLGNGAVYYYGGGWVSIAGDTK